MPQAQEGAWEAVRDMVEAQEKDREAEALHAAQSVRDAQELRTAQEALEEEARRASQENIRLAEKEAQDAEARPGKQARRAFLMKEQRITSDDNRSSSPKLARLNAFENRISEKGCFTSGAASGSGCWFFFVFEFSLCC